MSYSSEVAVQKEIPHSMMQDDIETLRKRILEMLDRLSDADCAEVYAKLSQKNLASAVQRLTAQTGFWRDLTRRNLYLLASKMPFVPELLKLHSLLFKKSGISPKPSYPPPSKPSSPATLTRQRRSSSRASRNLTDAQKTYLVGRQYEAQKMTQGNHAECGSDGKYLSAQNGPQGISPRTVEIVAKEHGVGSNTVLRSTREPERKNKCPKMGHLKSELKAQRKKL